MTENRNLESTRKVMKDKYELHIEQLKKMFLASLKKIQERKNMPNMQSGYTKEKVEMMKQKYIALDRFGAALRKERPFTLDIAKGIESLVPKLVEHQRKVVRCRD